MTREEIEQLNYVRPYCFETDMEEDWYKIGCIDGLNAADAEPNTTSIWHDASEEPRYDELLLGVDSDGVNIYKWRNQENNWESFANYFVLKRWAYIHDLLPKD